MQLLMIAVLIVVGAPIALAVLAWLCGVRYIPHNKVGIIEKLWSPAGSLTEGRIMARQGEAGFRVADCTSGFSRGSTAFTENRL